jgi:hypothetical protein
LITTNTTAVSNQRLIADTTGGAFNITLPATPSVGDYVQITDGGNLAAINCTVLRNGSTIENLSVDVILDMEGVTYEFIYGDNTWEFTATTGAQGATGATGPAGVVSTYETVNKNLLANDYALNYTGTVLTSIVYTLVPSGTITKTFNYTGDVLTSIVLSGDTPSGIELTKTLTYTSGILTQITYS